MEGTLNILEAKGGRPLNWTEVGGNSGRGEMAGMMGFRLAFAAQLLGRLNSSNHDVEMNGVVLTLSNSPRHGQWCSG